MPSVNLGHLEGVFTNFCHQALSSEGSVTFKSSRFSWTSELSNNLPVFWASFRKLAYSFLIGIMSSYS